MYMKNGRIVKQAALHDHTDFSNIKFPDSICKVGALIDHAREIELVGVAITDHDCVSSYVQAEKHLKKRKKENPEDAIWQNMKLILGNEIYLCRNGMNKENYIKGQDRYFHFILLAKDEIGNEQIRELSTRAWQRSYMFFHRRVPTYFSDLDEIIMNNPGHVIASSACLGGQLPFLIMEAKKYENKDKSTYNEYYEAITTWLNKIISIFGEGNFFLELQPGLSEEQIYVNRKLLELGKQHNIECIITTDSHYLKAEDREIHKAYLNSKEGEREVDDFYEAAHMMTVKEIVDRMSDYIEEDVIFDMLDNTVKIAERCEEYSVLKPLRLPYMPKPEFEQVLNDKLILAEDVAPHFFKFLNSDDAADRQLAIRLHNFLMKQNFSINKLPIKIEAINYELGIIWDSSEAQKVKWSKYFLQMADYVDIFWSEGNSIVAPGRGSATGSYVMFCLGIIQVDRTEEKVKLLFERFLNPERASVLDVDNDVESTKRTQCIEALQTVYGVDKVIRVATFKTEKAKSAILASARGLGIDVDTARYIASLIGSERGMQYTLTDMYYGNEEKELKPNKTFIQEMNKLPKLWEVARNIEGTIVGLGIHAGGVIIVDEPFTKTSSIMTTTKGEFITAFDLHDSEEISNIKIDLLATESLSKIRVCIDLLVKYGYVEEELTLKETYEKIIGVYNIDRDTKEMWELVWNNQIISLFQMEQQSGIQGIALTKPESFEDLASLNSIIRLMASERGAEQPLDKYARFRKDPREWEKEMDQYGLSTEEKEILHNILDYSSGLCAHQEDLYQLMQHPQVAGFGLGKADVLRKAIAKKAPQDYLQFEEDYFNNMKEKGLSERFCKYIWNVLVATSRGYSFSLNHTAAYSLIGIQEMNLAYKYPIIFWNTANLIIDSGAQLVVEDEDGEEIEVDTEAIEEEEVEEKEKIKNTTVKYGKVAAAIGKMQSRGIEIYPPNINKSEYTFTPDAEEGIIRYGMKGLTRVGDNVINDIMTNRPFVSVDDFLKRVKVNKPQMINLIKSGAFDDFDSREIVMENYINKISETKKKLNLQNANMLISQGLIPDELDFEKRVFNFNKYIKKNKVEIYKLDEIALAFYEAYFDMDLLIVDTETNSFSIRKTDWKNIYDKHMDKIREYIKENHYDLLCKLNDLLTQEVRKKYASGSLAKWSMDSVSFYQDEHELKNINLSLYGLSDFFNLPEEPQIDKTFTTKDGKLITMFKIHRIAGTVLDRDKSKNLIILLTPRGVVSVKAYGVFPHYDKQISEIGSDGKKKVIEKSMFTRGNKVIISGIRRGDMFIAKKYKTHDWHHFTQIVDIKKDGRLTLKDREVIE